MNLVLVSGTAGAVLFGLRAGGGLFQHPPLPVILWGLSAGATQYILMRLARVALARGPLSPMWCSVSLSFLVAVLYGHLAFGERIAPIQWLGLFAGGACIVVASRQQGGERDPGAVPQSPGDVLIYTAVLLAILALNSVPMVAIKDVAKRFSMGEDAFGNVFLFYLYGSMALLIVLDRIACGGGRTPLGATLLLGALVAFGSITGMSILDHLAGEPGAVVFTVTFIASILAASVVSVVAFRERAGAAWVGMLVLGILCLILVNLNPVP